MKLKKIAAAIGAAGLLSMGMASVASAEPAAEGEMEMCPVQVAWKTTSYLRPGAGNVERDPKELTHDADLAIDGWTYTQGKKSDPREEFEIGVDGWNESNTPKFRVVYGTMVPLTINDVTLTFSHPEEAVSVATQAPTPSSPAAAATPDRYKAVVLDDLAMPVVNGDTISWTVTNSAQMPAGSSATFQVTLNPLETESLEPVKAEMVSTGTVMVPCDKVEYSEWEASQQCVDGVNGLATVTETRTKTTTPYKLIEGTSDWELDTANATVETEVRESTVADENCRAPKPEDKVIEGEWSEVARKCVDTKAGIAEVTSERTVTTIPFVWDDITLTWMADEANAVETTESKTEKVDDASCVEKGGVTPTPDKPVKPQPPVDGDDLPDTGADMTTFGLSALGLLAVGGAAVMFARRRASN